MTETTLPTPPTGWSFGTPTYTPTDGTVTISETLAEVVVTNTIRQDVVSDLSQLTTAKTTCIQFSSGLAPDLERLLYTPTYNKKTGLCHQIGDAFLIPLLCKSDLTRRCLNPGDCARKSLWFPQLCYLQ